MPFQNEKIHFAYGTKAEFNILQDTADQNTVYVLTDTQEIYLGNTKIGCGTPLGQDIQILNEEEYEMLENKNAFLYFITADDIEEESDD